jgi:integrase/recombinase XerD
LEARKAAQDEPPARALARCHPLPGPARRRRARVSYRRAEEIFEENTWLLANPLVSPEDIEDIEDLDGWILHRLRHSDLTHDAEDGTSTPMLLARCRHASVRSLERYARPGVDAVARHLAQRDLAVRRRGLNRASASPGTPE